MGYYRIVEAQRPLVAGLAGHDLLAILNPAGQEIEEFDGLATSASGAIKPIGYLPSDTLQVYELAPSSPYAQYNSSEPSAQVASSTTLAGLQPYINAMTTCQSDINAEHLSYPFLGLGTNSNSVASTLDACMGVQEPSIPNSALITPGVGTLVLPTSTIAAVQTANGLNKLSTTGDNAVTGESTGTTVSTVDTSNGEGITTVATLGELTTHAGVVDGNDYLTEKNAAGAQLVTQTNIITPTGTETLAGTGTATNPLLLAATDQQVDIGGSTYAQVFGTGNYIFAKGVNNTYTNVGVKGTDDVIAGLQSTINVLNSADTLTVESTNSTINAGSTTSDLLSLDGAYDILSGVGTGSTVNINASADGATLASGDIINLASSINTDKITGGINSDDTANVGNSTDAIFDGGHFKINLGTGDNINSDGTGNVITVHTGDIVDLPSNMAVTIDGNGATIVGNAGDNINVTGTSDMCYADTSTITINGTDTGDIVHGEGDSGDRSDWGGYVAQSGGYGGYGGGGYYGSVSAIKPARGAPQARSGVMARANIEAIGAADHGLSTERIGLDDSVLTSSRLSSHILDAAVSDAVFTRSGSAGISLSSTKRSSIPSAPQTMVDQLIHAMATWPASAASSMFNPPNDTVDTASIHLLAKSSLAFHASAENHAHAA